MYSDFYNYQKFYHSSIGNLLSSHVEDKLKKHCYLYNDQNIGCFGYCDYFLNFLNSYHLSISYCYPKKIGTSGESIRNGNKVLVDEESLPFDDSVFHHSFLIHYLENTLDRKRSLREIWRTLLPEGKLYLIVPNQKSLWYLSSKSPFSTGQGFSKKKITRELNDLFFDIQFIDRLVYFPNSNLNIIKNYKNIIDKFGSTFLKYFNGTYLCVAKKRIYADLSPKVEKQKNFTTGLVKKI